MKYILFIITLALFYSCSTVKEVTKEVVKYDSSYIRKTDSLNLQLISLKTKYEKLKVDASKTGVIFKDVLCPDVKIDSSCNQDSLVKIVKQQQEYIKSMSNTIKVNADGSKEFRGQIESFSQDIYNLEVTLNQMEFDNMNLRQVNDSLSAEINKFNSHTDISIKRKWFTGFGMWIIFLVIGYVVGTRYNIFSLLKR